MAEESFPRGGQRVLSTLEMRDIARKAEEDAIKEVHCT